MMMGQSATVATAFAAAIFLIGIIITVQTSLSSIQSISTTIKDQVSKSELILAERCRSDYWEINGTTIELDVTNIGEASFRAKDFYQMEVFAHYLVGGKDRVARFEFSNTTSGENWSITKIYFNSRLGEIINPINIGETTGLWDPYETIVVNIPLPLGSESVEYVTFVLPNGFTSSKGFSQKELGSTTILTGSLNVNVSHNLPTHATNIQVTPTSEIQTNYWVTYIDDTTFSINLRESQSVDITFSWRATS